MIYLYLASQRSDFMTAGRIMTVWERSNIFKEYQKPDLSILHQVVEEVKSELRTA